MPKSIQSRINRIISALATFALIIQVVLPGGIFNYPVGTTFAATNTWEFTTPSSYNFASGMTVADTYVTRNLALTGSSDSLDGYGPTTDLVETDINGRIIAAVSEFPPPFSTDYGITWTSSGAASGGEIQPQSLTKITSGVNSGRIIAGGPIYLGGGTAGHSYSDDDGATWTNHTAIAGLSGVGAVYYDAGGLSVWLGGDDGTVHLSTDDGESFVTTDGAPKNATAVHDFVKSGSTIYAAATITGAGTTTTSIFYSTDTGGTWTQATNTGGTASSHDTVYSLAVDSSGYVYGIPSTNGQVLKSNAAEGTTFSIVTVTGMSNARDIYIDSSDGIYIPGSTIYRSLDGGTDFFAQDQTDVSAILYAHEMIRVSAGTFPGGYIVATEGAASSGDAYANYIAEVSVLSFTIDTTPAVGPSYSSLVGFSESMASTSETGLEFVQYQISDSPGGTWYYWDGGAWSEAATMVDSNTASTIDANISSFSGGEFHFRAVLLTDGAFDSVALDSVSVEYDNNSITITTPDTNTDWDIGETETISWTESGTSPDHYDVYYAEREDEGSWGSWIQEADNYTTAGTGYAWEIPVVSYPHATYKNYKVKVESYTAGDSLIASDESDAFIINYGAVDSFNVEAPNGGWPQGEVFPLTVTALDQYGNTITNFNNTVTISASPGPISPTTIGNGASTGTWTNGTVTHDGYIINIVGEHTITASYSGATGQDTILIQEKGSGGDPDKTKPESELLGLLENDRIIPPNRIPKVIMKRSVTVIAGFRDDSGLPPHAIELYYKHSDKDLMFTLYPKEATLYIPRFDDSRLEWQYYYTWTFSIDRDGTGRGDGLYYLYSVATDRALNREDPPVLPQKYDLSLNFQTTGPKIISTDPVDGDIEVGIELPIEVVFDREMDKNSVFNAFCLTTDSTIGSAGNLIDCIELEWSAEWPIGYNKDQLVRFNHGIPFERDTLYYVYINPEIARDTDGLYLRSDSDVPNPWSFRSAPVQNPDLSNSDKVISNIYDGDTGTPKDGAPNPGDKILYSIVIRNTGQATSHTTITDAIPEHTTFDNYSYVWPINCPNGSGTPSSGFSFTYDEGSNSMVGEGMLPGGCSQKMDFQVEIDSPLDHETHIVNTAVVDDGNNKIHYPTAEAVVESTTNWEGSFKTTETTLAKVGDILTYTISIHNTGDTHAYDVLVEDKIPNFTAYIPGSATGGLQYDGPNNQLWWQGDVFVGDDPMIFTFKVKITSQPDDNKIINTTTITDQFGSYNKVVVVEIDIVPDDDAPPYITAVSPEDGTTNVLLFTPLTIEFSDEMDTDTLEYKVLARTAWTDPITGEPIYETLYDTTMGDTGWSEMWSYSEGNNNAKVTIQPNEPLRSPGIHHIVKVLSARGISGLPLAGGMDIPVPDNQWGFSTVAPTLIFEQPATLWLKVNEPSEAIKIKLVNWTNHDNPDAPFPNYEPYTVEDPNGLSVRLMTTNRNGTGTFDIIPDGAFDGSVTSVHMSYNSDSATFYFKESAITMAQYPPYRIIVGPAEGTEYTVFGGSRPYVSTPDGEEAFGLRVSFKTAPQSVPVNKLSSAVKFGVYEPGNGWVNLRQGDTFLLSTSSATGRFYNRYGNPISEFATFQTNGGIKRGYLLVVDQDRQEEKFFYEETETPGYYTITVEDLGQVQITAGGQGLATQGTQNITIVPIEDQDLELDDELEEVEDETGREIDYIVVDPEDTIVLPGAIRTFTAKGYDTEGQEIDELKFSWYVIAGGGTIVKKGADGRGHTTTFTADLIPGVYRDTVLVATLYNGEIKAALATVRVADVVDYGGPGRLPSTGPNGIQMLFIGLTLLSAVALAAVEHYEKTQLQADGTEAK